MVLGGIALLGWSAEGVGAHIIRESQVAVMWQETHGYTVPVSGLFHFNHPPLAPGQPVTKMSIPKLNYSTIVIEGVDDNSLAAGPGHYLGSAWPGEPDTMIIEGHNGFWLGFPALAQGDEINFDDRDGQFTYVVDSHQVVDPSQAHLKGTGTPTLRLVTCWPVWMGALAPQRLIIYAHLKT
jgi:sortase A